MRIAHLLSGVVLTSALGLQSCQQEPLKMPAREEYAREFYKNFKNVDPDHDWNQAQKSSVTVKTSRPSSIKVMADIKGKRYLFADYREASGSNEIPLTLPKSVTDIIVKVNGQNFPAKLGATVDASSASSASRTVWETENEPIKVRLTDNRLFRTPEEVLRYREYLPEEVYNIGRVTQDFLFESKGPFLVYPAYYNTSQYSNNILGIYYYKEVNGEKKLVTQDFFQLGNGKTMMFTSDKEDKTSSQTLYSYQAAQFNVPSGADSYDKYTDDDWKFMREQVRIGEIWFVSNNYKLFSEFKHKVDEGGNAIITGTYKEYEAVYGKNGYTSIPDEAETLAFQAIEVDIPEGQIFGMYLKLKDKKGDPTWGIDPQHTIFFSESDLNTDYLWAPKPEFKDKVTKKSEANTDNSEYLGKDSENPTHACHAAAFTRPEDGMIRLCFEDWYNDHETRIDSDFDLNDMVFYIDGLLDTPPPSIVEDDPDPEPEPYQWIIAAEDLGGSYDWDFNDVVAGVSIEAMKDGEKEFSKVTVTPLASGGTLPVYFMYSGKIVDPKTGDPIANSDSDYVIGGEFHSLFGRDFGSFINASKDEHIKAEPIIFYTPAGHSLASSGHVHYDGTNMGGFWVLASEMNSPLDLNPANNYGLISIAPGTTTGFNKITNSKPIASEDLTAPQIICVETDWAWPLEEKNIKKAYPEFETWVGDESHRTWINNKNGELTVNR